MTDLLNLAEDLVARVRRAGADAADAVAVQGTSSSVSWRLGAFEDYTRSEAITIGLRVFVGKRHAIVSTTDPSTETINDLCDRVLAMATAAPEDPFAGLAPDDLIAREIPEDNLELDGNDEPLLTDMKTMAAEAEDAARSVDGVTNSEGAAVSWQRVFSALVASNGFNGAWTGTSSSISTSVIAGEGLNTEGESEYAVARHFADLPAAATVGAEAGRRAAERIGAARIPTMQAPLVFDNRVSGGLLGHLVSAITGPSIARGASFLLDQLGAQIFPAGINIVDEPHRRRGLRSCPFDGEGLRTSSRKLIDNGYLTTWLLECRSARQLEMTPTGHARRSASGPPSPGVFNLWLEPGNESRDELIADISDGLLITGLSGQGVNGITGDYSRGASGFRIENGQLTRPVNEVTVAGNLKDMFARARPASDLEFRYGIDAPSVRIEGMTVAGL